MPKLKPILFTATAILALAQIRFAQKEIPMPTEKGNLSLIFNGFAQDVLRASIRNDTPFKFFYVRFSLYGYDAKGNDSWLCGTHGISADGGCVFHLFDSIEPGQTLTVASPGDSAVGINTSAIAAAARTEFKIIEATYFVKYDIRADPIENAKFVISPSFGLKGIGLTFRNKSSDAIEVAWISPCTLMRMATPAA